MLVPTTVNIVVLFDREEQINRLESPSALVWDGKEGRDDQENEKRNGTWNCLCSDSYFGFLLGIFVVNACEDLSLPTDA